MLNLPKNQNTDNYNPLKEAYDEIFRRYNTIAQNVPGISREHRYKIMQMGIHCISHHEMPIDKTSRWLGFIQGILWAGGFIDIKQEREFTRPLIHQAYIDMGKEPPETIDLDQMLIDSWE